jgi:DNA-binding transcriptional LysR family regulator
MHSYSFDGLPHFLAVAELGSFAAAAHSLGVSPSAVSQAVRGLEQRLGARLFNRTTRSVALTEAGARYLERVSPRSTTSRRPRRKLAARRGALKASCASMFCAPAI